MRRTFLSLILSIAVPNAVFAQADAPIVLDNSDQQTSVDGAWTIAKSSRDKFGEDYAFTSTSGGGSTASLTYRPDIKVAGRYNIEIWYTQGENRATAAQWEISCESGPETVSVNQTKNGGKWFQIAQDKQFKAGTSGYIKINNSGPSGSVAVADAVRLVPSGGSSSSSVTSSSSDSKSKNTTDSSSGKKNYSLKVLTEGGTVTKSPDQLTYPSGTTVTLTANANNGSVFDGWSDNPGEEKKRSYKNPLKITVMGDTTIAANFSPAGVGVIMDNADAGVEFKGPWLVNQQAWPGMRYKDYKVTAARPAADAWATYRPTFPKAGKYDVYVWYSAGGNRTTSAAWTVSGKGGKVLTTPVNQKVGGGGWVSVATGMEFEAGKKDNQYAQLSNTTVDSGTGTVVIADAVAFVFVGE